MGRFLRLISTATVLLSAALAVSCMSASDVDTSRSEDNLPLNPACSDGFRPSGGRPCSY